MIRRETATWLDNAGVRAMLCEQSEINEHRNAILLSFLEVSDSDHLPRACMALVAHASVMHGASWGRLLCLLLLSTSHVARSSAVCRIRVICMIRDVESHP